jgi:hypothetical protein
VYPQCISRIAKKRAGGEERREFVFARIHGLEVDENAVVREALAQFLQQSDTVVLDAGRADFEDVDVRRHLFSERDCGVEVQVIDCYLSQSHGECSSRSLGKRVQARAQAGGPRHRRRFGAPADRQVRNWQSKLWPRTLGVAARAGRVE